MGSMLSPFAVLSSAGVRCYAGMQLERRTPPSVAMVGIHPRTPLSFGRRGFTA